MDWHLPAAVVCPFVASWLLTALLIRWAPRLGLVDHPGERKVHTRPTPRGGGLAIYLALVLTTALLSPGPHTWLLLGVGFFVALLGLADDWRPLAWRLRLAVQSVVALAAVLLWSGPVGWPLRLLGAFWIVAMLNALNMLDNMDALSGGVAWIAAGFFAVALWPRADEAAMFYLMLMAALSGFLWFNRPPARIFLGDAGSTFLGFALGLGSLNLGLDSVPEPWPWAVPLCILAVPCYDMTSVICLRLRQRRSPFHGDKQHLSHRLVARGLTSMTAVRVIYLLALASGASGLVLYHVDGWPGALLVVGQLACGWAALAVVELLSAQKQDR
jgi:UDP-GlcNAc:undecaprenyl-phosphate GlcNAc-1-phosphate transferase